MSLVYITYHDENIFDVDKEKEFLMSRQRLKYNSKFKQMVRDEKNSRHVIDMPGHKKLLTSSAKNSHQTMGYAVTPVELPSNFLKKHQGVKWQRLNEHKCPPKREIPPVPHFPRPHTTQPELVKELKRDNEDLMCPRTRYFKGHKHRANFVALNVELIKKSQTKRPPPRYVDTPNGDRHSLLNSGLIPQHICSKKFGKVPCYIDGRKKMLKTLNERCSEAKLEAENACVRYMDRMPGVRKLTNDERNEILKVNKLKFKIISKLYNTYVVSF